GCDHHMALGANRKVRGAPTLDLILGGAVLVRPRLVVGIDPVTGAARRLRATRRRNGVRPLGFGPAVLPERGVSMRQLDKPIDEETSFWANVASPRAPASSLRK